MVAELVMDAADLMVGSQFNFNCCRILMKISARKGHEIGRENMERSWIPFVTQLEPAFVCSGNKTNAIIGSNL